MSQERDLEKREIEAELEYKRRYEKKSLQKRSQLVETRRRTEPLTIALKSPIFKIKLKEERKIVVGEPKSLNIGFKELKFPRLNVIPLNIASTKPLSPKIKISSTEKPNDIKVPIYEPLTVQTYNPSPLQLQIKTRLPQDFSVRPLLRPERVNLTKIEVSLPKIWPSPILQPKLLPLISTERQPPLKPKLKLPGKIELVQIPEVAKTAGLITEASAYPIEQRLLKRREITAVQKETIAVETVKGKEDEVEELKHETFFEFFLQEKSGKGFGGITCYTGEPIYVILSKPLIQDLECKDLLHYLCIRSIREHIGTLPETRAFQGPYARSEIEKYLGEREITIIEEKAALSEKPSVKKEPQGWELPTELNEDAIADRIKDIGKGLKYIIFYIAQGKAKPFYDKIWKFRSKFHDKIFLIEPKELPLQTRKKLAEIAWGFINLPETATSYDDLFGNGKNIYYRELEKICESVNSNMESPYPIVQTHRLGPESWEHYLLKCFVVKYLTDNPPQELTLSRIGKEKRHERIKTEEKIWGDSVVSDVYVEEDEDKVAIEVETLFEEGKYGGMPIAKIRDETVEKYKECTIHELWVVLENLTLLRHFKKILELDKLYNRWYEKGRINFKVKFLTLNIRENSLVDLKYVVKALKEVVQP